MNKFRLINLESTRAHSPLFVKSVDCFKLTLESLNKNVTVTRRVYGVMEEIHTGEKKYDVVYNNIIDKKLKINDVVEGDIKTVLNEIMFVFKHEITRI